MADLTQEHEVEEKKTSPSKKTKLTIEIAGAALFSALSIVVGAFLTPTLTQLLRIPGWFIAIIDLISLIWVACFFLFGARAGLLCCIIGTIGLMPFDFSAPVGPLMKLAATVSLIIVPIIFLKLYKREPGVRKSQKLKEFKNIAIYGALGTLLRIVVMVLLNILVFLTVFSIYIDQISLAFLGLPEVTGLTAVIIGAPLINAWQSGLDLIIPYIIIYGGKLDQQFEIW